MSAYWVALSCHSYKVGSRRTSYELSEGSSLPLYYPEAHYDLLLHFVSLPRQQENTMPWTELAALARDNGSSEHAHKRG